MPIVNLLTAKFTVRRNLVVACFFIAHLSDPLRQERVDNLGT
jgi:hypothetical protein